MSSRTAQEFELPALAQLWYDGWQDAHAQIVPAELAQHRTVESFHRRLQSRFAEIRVVGPPGRPDGFCLIKEDELYQLFVAASARGTGLALTLLEDAERRLSECGVELAWLACAIGNNRAARFYEKNGWTRVGNMIDEVDIETGTYPLEVWRYEKRVGEPKR